jgi:hypothetical protein
MRQPSLSIRSVDTLRLRGPTATDDNPLRIRAPIWTTIERAVRLHLGR